MNDSELRAFDGLVRRLESDPTSVAGHLKALEAGIAAIMGETVRASDQNCKVALAILEKRARLVPQLQGVAH